MPAGLPEWSGLKFGQALMGITLSRVTTSHNLTPDLMAWALRPTLPHKIRAQAGAINTRLNPKGLQDAVQQITFAFWKVPVIPNSI